MRKKNLRSEVGLLEAAARPTLSSSLRIGSQMDALLEKLRGIVANGIVSERRIAQAVGMSQPHIHHLLSGERALTVPVADRLLATLEISSAELLDEFQVGLAFQALRRRQEPRVPIPFLSGKAGPRGPLPGDSTDTMLIDCLLLKGLTNPVLVAIGEDSAMVSALANATHAILHAVSGFAADPDALYAVELEGHLVARGMRPGAICTYLLTALNWNQPAKWQGVQKTVPVRGLVPVRREVGGYYSIAMPEAAAAS